MTKGDPSLKRSKSLCALLDVVLNAKEPVEEFIENTLKKFQTPKRSQSSSNISDSSVDNVEMMIIDSDSEAASTHTQGTDGLGTNGLALQVLEQKIDRLSDMFLEQCRLLTFLKEDIRNSKVAMEKTELAQTEVLTDIVKKTFFLSNVKDGGSEAVTETVPEFNSRAQSLLAAIESRQQFSLEREIKEALLAFLQSDELKGNMVAATAESVRSVIGDCFSRDLSSLYLPLLDHSHKRLVRYVTKTIEDAFVELEENSVCLSRSVFKMTRSLRRCMERHQGLLQAAADPHTHVRDSLKHTVEQLLHSELKQWRQKVLDVFTDALQLEPLQKWKDTPKAAGTTPRSPLQPADPDRTAVDQLMMAAEINKQIESGDANGAFTRALSAADLSLVMAACRAGERAAVFTPKCRLAQPVLLALLQQLSTDVLHETHLKCRFLEDSIMNLDTSDALTRSHLPLVIGEVRKHLTRFLTTYPGHTAHRRVALIIMAADNLLK